MIKIFSYGGGVQSTAALVLQTQGKLEFDKFVFANVGDDSENPETLKYFREVALPFAKKNNVDIVEVRKTTRGKEETLLNYMYRIEKGIAIPLRMNGNGAPGNRTCTNNFKIYQIEKYVKSLGVKKYIAGLGISTDEIHRARSEEWTQTIYKNLEVKRTYPLIKLNISRKDCKAIIKNVGLPIPPKSACWFCPFTRHLEWVEMRMQNPERFEKVVEIEKMMQEKRKKINKDPVWYHPSLKPLEVAVGLQENFFDELDNCESGYCMI